jgi:threonine aldolase
MTVDLRSDTVTRPTPGMLEAMFSAKVGDDVFGEDETVSQLEEKAAALFGMDAGLFCPSGTAHVYRYEGGGIAFNSAVSTRLLNGYRGLITAEMIEPEINADNIHYPRTSLVVLENTSNKGGGSCYTLEQIKPIAELCQSRGLKLHLDGARLFNALAHTGDSTADYGQCFDGISVCLSKGLGAPVGSVLLGDMETIKQARRIRKVLGGGMRQAGFLAAAGIYALDHHVERLKIDHAHARIISDELGRCSWVSSVMPVETNIVLFDTLEPADSVVERLAGKGIKAMATAPNRVRLVLHLDVHPEQVEYVVKTLKGL